ncbi:MAG: arginine--tRNA ligase [Desulfamplus sp.]|nr:arginine--tRNA ligase [Desulfamplus sp.]
MKNRVREIILHAVENAFAKGLLKAGTVPEMEIETPRHDHHGDFSSNVAMVSASVQKMAPKKIAQAIVDSIEDPGGIIEKMEIAGPGFINIFLKKSAWYPLLTAIHHKKDAFGRSDLGQGTKVQVEFVSANPTGPLHIGHGRGAAVGDSVGNILAFAGFDVEKEYYINDSGRQIRTLGLSAWLRICEFLGQDINFPETCYQGDYIRDIAREIMDALGDVPCLKPDPSLDPGDNHEAISMCAKFAAEKILRGIREDLSDFGVTFDRWFSEQSLYDAGRVDDVISHYRSLGVIYEKDGALWFATERYGDEKDRVVVRNNGITTYFASDIAYHMDKFHRGFNRVIDVWGADHHGYINRIKASIEAGGGDPDNFNVILVQLVNLLRSGEPVAMSTRSGEFVTLKDIVKEVGRDAARFIFLSRSYDSGLDFDLEVAKQQTSENPVYYVQYVHARICAMLLKACEQSLLTGMDQMEDIPFFTPHLLLLCEPEEMALIKLLASFPHVVEKAAATLHPHVIFTYLMSLASRFHAYYNQHKVITDHRELSLARLFLVSAVKIVIGNALGLLGVSAPERM